MAINGQRFPGGKRFAFTVFDDADSGTLDSVGPVYTLLSELNFLTTKSVWVFPTDPNRIHAGSTLQDREYLRFLLQLQERGFEIALHNVQNGDATRDVTERGIEDFRNLLGHYPATHANHMDNRDNVYWGPHRLNQFKIRAAYEVATRFRYVRHFGGHDPRSEFFWGDICKERVKYVRNFVFTEVNLDRVNPTLPYHDPTKPYVNYWFSSTEGGNARSFCRAISEENQDRLEAEGGVCIMYTHFADGFCKQGTVHPEFERLMTRLAAKNGWFVPVSTLLDRMLEDKSDCKIPADELRKMERSWLSQRLVTAGSNAIDRMNL